MKRKKKLKSVNTIPWQADAVLNLIFIVWSVLCIVPFLLVLGVSFSSESSLNLQGYRVIPKELSFAAYDYVFSKSGMLLRAYGITIGATLSGTILSLIVTAMFAYPLSRKYFKYRKIFSFIAFFTMIFNGGAVSSYMVYTQILYMKNNYFVYILPYLMSAWNMILLRTFTVGLFTAIGIWNDWYTPSLYIKDTSMHNLQYMLYSMLTSAQYLKANMDKVGGSAGLMLANMPSEGIRMAMCIVTIGPIVLAYPFFQKYFVKGLTVGAVKG